jgi:putative transposase
MSEQRACRVIGCCRMTMRYEAIRQDDPVLRERLKDLARVRRRFGYRRLQVFLRREDHEIKHRRAFRAYREERLHVRRRGGRKRALGTRAPVAEPLVPNQRWPLDFVSDQLTDGPRFRVLTVVDDGPRDCLALIADTSLSGARVVRELATLFEVGGKPMTVVSDNGTEFTSNAILTLADDHWIEWPSPFGSNQWHPNGSATRQTSRPGMPSSKASTAVSVTNS